jgi:hypothetical protein
MGGATADDLIGKRWVKIVTCVDLRGGGIFPLKSKRAAASTMTRRSFPISITMWPLVGLAGVDGIGSATTIAGTKPDLCPAAPSGSAQNDRRQFCKSEREMPYRRAVDEIARGVCMLSRTILSFSSSVQRRRRAVSTTPSRST